MHRDSNYVNDTALPTWLRPILLETVLSVGFERVMIVSGEAQAGKISSKWISWWGEGSAAIRPG